MTRERWWCAPDRPRRGPPSKRRKGEELAPLRRDSRLGCLLAEVRGTLGEP